MKRRVKLRRITASATVAFTAVCAFLPTAEATIVWDGLDGTDNVHWTVPGNWNPDGAPTPGTDDLRFPVTTGNRVTNNDFPANSQFNGIDVTGAGYTLAGNAINLAGNITHSASGSGDTVVSLILALQQNTTFSVTSTLRLRPDGDISGAYSLTKEGTGTIRLSAGTKKTYTGDTTVNGGLLDVIGDFLPSGAGKGNIILNSPATLQNNNSNFTINGLSGNGAITKIGSNTRSITLGDGNANGIFTGTISQSAGTLGITKIGTGTQAIGNSTHNGVTTISNGIYLENGTHTGAANGYSVAAGATLGGTGIINLTTGVVAINGTLAPGDSPGTLDIDNPVTFNNLSAFTIEIDGASPADGNGFYDQLNMTDAASAVTLTGSVTLNASLPNGYAPSPSDVFYVLTRADAAAFANTFNGLPEGATVNLGSGYTAQITYVANWTGTQAGSALTGGNDIALYNPQFLPEPGSIGLILAVIGMSTVSRPRRHV